ncbi:MAG: hypothetical protein N2512_15500 [Armatimonadetes bacterium]|nr:hypothetical protein [Armatimonadota bacterium]
MALALVLILVLLSQRGKLAGFLASRSQKPEEPSISFPMALTVKTPEVWRDGLVPIVVTTLGPDRRLAPLPQPPTVAVLRGGVPQPTVGHVEILQPVYDRGLQAYVAYWPVPWNAPLGEYVVEARCEMRVPEAWDWGAPVRSLPRSQQKDDRLSEAVARSPVLIKARRPPPLQPGLCVVTWEDHPPTGRLRRPDGTLGDWRALLDWAEFMGADAFWCRGAVTQVGDSPLSMQQPFAADEPGIRRLAAEAHLRGIKFGVWAVAFASFPKGRNTGKPPYRYAQVLRPDGSLADHDFISLLDPDRPRHLADFLSRMSEDPNIDMVGLDYFRPDRGGYEIVDGFLRSMPVKENREFSGLSRVEKIRRVARLVEREWRTHTDFYEQWKWYQAHLVAKRLRDILALAQLRKPLFIFIFGWNHGAQSGQDPLMLTDAGASALAVMLYQVSSPRQFDLMVRQWQDYLEPGQANLIPGNQLDFYWHQNLIRPRAAPEELYRRMVAAHSDFINGDKTLGVFWHDISRAAVSGRTGPYPGREWALAGAAAFSAVRRSWNVYPLSANLLVPQDVPWATVFTAEVVLQSLCDRPVRDLRLRIEDTQGVEVVEERAKTLAELPARGQVRIPWRLKLRGPIPTRGNRFMVACRVTWPDGDYGPVFRRDVPRTIIAMQYVNGR